MKPMRWRRWGCALLVLAVLLAVGGCTSRETRKERQLAKAQEYMKKGELRPALLSLQDALRADPKDPETNLKIGQLLDRSHHYSDALFYYREALRLDPKNSEAALGAAGLLLFQHTDEAEKLINGVIERDPKNAHAYMSRSSVDLIRGDIPKALVAAETAVQLDPKSPFVYMQLGVVRRTKIRKLELQHKVPEDGDFEAAESAFRQALKVSDDETPGPLVAKAWMEIANVYLTWPHHRKQAEAIYREAIGALQKRPAARLRLIDRAVQVGMNMTEGFLHWALEQQVAAQPANYLGWLRLAQTASQSGERPDDVLDRMLEKRGSDALAWAAYERYMVTHQRAAEAIPRLEAAVPKVDHPDEVLGQVLRAQDNLKDLEGMKATLARLEKSYPDSEQIFYGRAVVATREGRMGDACDALKAWVAKRETVEGYRLLSQAELSNGDFDAAVGAANRAVELAKREKISPIGPLLTRGEALLRNGDPEAALRSLERARRLAGGVVPGRYVATYATALIRTKHPDAALKFLEFIDKKQGKLRPRLALLYAQLVAEHDPKAARKVLESAYESVPGYAPVVNALIVLDFRAKKPDAALALARQAAERAPKSPEVHVLLARVLVHQGKLDEAAKVARQALKSWPEKPGAAEILVSVYQRQGQMDAAIQDLESQLKSKQGLSLVGRVLLARLYIATGRKKEAMPLLEKVVDQDPKMVGAGNDLAYLLAEKGVDLDRATTLAQRAREDSPNTSAFADTLGYVYLKRKVYAAALAQFQAAVESAQSGSTPWARAEYHQGLALHALGRSKEAAEAVERSLASGADFPEAADARTLLAKLSHPAKS